MSKLAGTYKNVRPEQRFEVWEGTIPGTYEPGFREQPIVQLPVDERLKEITQGGLDLRLFRFRMGECTILLGQEPANNKAMRWHLTISCPHRHPSWDEIKVAKYRLTGPDLPMAMILPPAEHYINVENQDHVFQLWQLLRDEAYDAWVVP